MKRAVEEIMAGAAEGNEVIGRVAPSLGFKNDVVHMELFLGAFALLTSVFIPKEDKLFYIIEVFLPSLLISRVRNIGICNLMDIKRGCFYNTAGDGKDRLYKRDLLCMGFYFRAHGGREPSLRSSSIGEARSSRSSESDSSTHFFMDISASFHLAGVESFSVSCCCNTDDLRARVNTQGDRLFVA